MISNTLHAIAHWWDKSACTCRTQAFMDGIRFRRNIELRELSLPSSPAALDAELRRKIADSERPAA